MLSTIHITAILLAFVSYAPKTLAYLTVALTASPLSGPETSLSTDTPASLSSEYTRFYTRLSLKLDFSSFLLVVHALFLSILSCKKAFVNFSQDSRIFSPSLDLGGQMGME